MIPGEYFVGKKDIECNTGRLTVVVSAVNTGDRPVQVGSHFHFFEVNRQIEFDREKTFGMRLNIAAGTAVRFEPGDTKTVQLVDIGGNRVIRGGNALADGPVSEAGLSLAMTRVRDLKFADESQNAGENYP